MPSRHATAFIEAKAVLRQHRDWTDEQVAERVGISKFEISRVVTPARADLEADDPDFFAPGAQVGERPFPRTDAQDAEAARMRDQAPD
jgi:transcriptional regulator with XRE-family HTH domain